MDGAKSNHRPSSHSRACGGGRRRAGFTFGAMRRTALAIGLRRCARDLFGRFDFLIGRAGA
jgi:hypothetical protein